MATKTINFNQLPNELAKMIPNLIKEQGKTRAKTTKQAGTFMVKTAKGLAPYKSGDTKEGIIGFKEGKNYAVQSTVPRSRFHQNMWANNTPGWLGTQKKLPYPMVQKTGVSGGGFFTKAQKLTEAYFEGIVIKDVSKWKLIK